MFFFFYTFNVALSTSENKKSLIVTLLPVGDERFHDHVHWNCAFQEKTNTVAAAKERDCVAENY